MTNANSAVPPPSAPLQWDITHLKALLRLSRFPPRLIQEEPWRTWLEQHGGLNEVHAYLRACDLAPAQRKLLDLLLAHPYASVQFYAGRLNISLPTYFNHLRSLLTDLLNHLNSWDSVTQTAPARPRPGNLPAALTSFIGAESAVQTVSTLLQHPVVRLLTLTGPGGIGKTRLALQAVAGQLELFPDGVFFVTLAPISDPQQVTARIAQTLELQDVRSRSAQTILLEHLRYRQLLLILDNFEHLIPAAPAITELLAAAPKLKVLVTSRAALRVYGEHEFAVPPLAVPELKSLPDLQRLAEYPAVRLFVERAQAVQRSFALTEANAAAVAEICARLDGLPLAIELAAARVNFFSSEGMLGHLERRLALLTDGAWDLPPRHRTLRGAIDWSYQLLDPQEQSLFRGLAVFVNGFTAKAAEAVCGDLLPPTATGDMADVPEGLSRLVHKSLLQIQAVPGPVPRFAMLETIREYALERLTAGGGESAAGVEASVLRQRHVAYYLKLAETAEPEISGPQQHAWLERLEQEHDNISAAIGWALEQHDAETALRFTSALWRFWQIRSHLTEGRRWLERTLAICPPLEKAPALAPLRIKSLWGAGWITSFQSDYTVAGQIFEEGLALARQTGDRRGIGLMLQGLGEVAQFQGNYSRAEELFNDSLAIFRELHDAEETAWALDHLGRIALDQSRDAEAQALLEESRKYFRSVGHRWGIALSLDRLGLAAFRQGDCAGAAQLYEEALAIFKELGNHWYVAWLLEHLGQVVIEMGDLSRAREMLHQSLELHREAHSPHGIALTLEGFAALAARRQDGFTAAQLCGAAKTLLDADGIALSPHHQGRHDKTLAIARALLGDAAFEAAWVEGRALNAEQAMARALAVE